MKRWIQETNSNRASFQCFIKSFEVSLLIWKNLLKSCFSFFYSVRTDHLTECCNSVFFEEHMLCTAKSDTFCSKLTSFLSICRSICISTNFKFSIFVSPSHNTAELTSDGSVNCLDFAIVDVTCCTIDRDEISLMEFFSSKSEFLILFVHSDITTSGYTACTHTTGNYSCVRCHTTTNS